MAEREYVGTVGVDSGSIWVGDPCYVIGEDSSYGVKDWDEYCDKLFANDPKLLNPVHEPLGSQIGLSIGCFGGDGGYPVYITRGRDGLVTKVEVFFYYSVDADPEIFGYDDPDEDESFFQ